MRIGRLTAIVPPFLLSTLGMLAPAGAAPAAALRWTDATPDAMVDDALARATAPGAPEHAQAAALMMITSLASRASDDHARAALGKIAAAPGATAEVRAEAALLARMVANDEGEPAGMQADHALGIVQGLSILGPFRDTGGGLDAHDGPESEARPFDTKGRYAWGTFDVAWRAVPRAFASAGGVPLDLFLHPRKESCAWVATALTVTQPQLLTVRVASTGQVRLVFDDTDLVEDDAVHGSLRFDRLAGRVDAKAGVHLLAAKVCAGALDDDGQTRLRVTNDAGTWPEGVADAPWIDKALPENRSLSGKAAPPTLLARTIAGAADADTRLDDAIVRTWGGADDLRSPRAPGLLASLADGGLDPDRLALAAWIAPLGANRSAWLARAREHGDAGTRAFAARRLVERHLGAGLVDWAMAALRGAKIDEARDDEAATLTARVEMTLGTDALKTRALYRLEALQRANPAGISDAALRLLSSAADPLDPRVVLATTETLAKRGNRGLDRVRVVTTALGRAASVEAGRQALDGWVSSADEAIGVAQTVARTGDHAAAHAMFATLTGWAPDRAEVWEGLAQETSATTGDVLAPTVIEAALRRARELEPGDASLRAQIALRTPPPPASAGPTGDEKYIVPSETILARRQPIGAAAAAVATRSPAPGVTDAMGGAAPRAAAAPDVDEWQLYWLRAVVMHPDRRVSEMVQYAREIAIPPRTEEELYENIPAEGDLTEILRARVHRAGGGEAFPVEEASDRGQPRIRWPELSPGDVVEVAFRSWTAGPVGGRGDPPFYRLDYAGAVATHPILYNEDVIESPPDRPLSVSVFNGKANRHEEKDESGHHVARFIWDHPPSVPDEPLSPPMSEVVPMLAVSTFPDWSAFRAWYGDAVHGFTEPDAQVRDLAAKLTKGKGSRDDKLRAIFDFVADDIRYVNYVSGEWWLPNRPQQLLARREGDCDDKALLLITLLKSVGIEAQEVMVQTRMTNEPSVLRAPGAAVPLFDHGIAFLPGPGGGTYLDATSPQSRLGPLPSMDARAVALRMDGPASIVELPASKPEDHGIASEWTVRLAADGAADLEGSEHALGDDAFWMRTYLTEPGARAQWVEDHLIGPWTAGVEVDKKVDFQGDLARGGAAVRWRARTDALARHEGSELVVPLSASQTLASQIAPLVTRTLPVWLPPTTAPRREARTIRIVAPKGWRFEALPAGGDENGGPFGSAHLDVTRDPRDARAVVAHRIVTFDESRIGVEQYPRWRAWVQRVDALMHKAVRLEPEPGR